MAPSRKQTNGRSPLVNPQRQITSFFAKTTSPSPSPSPSLSTKQSPNSNPNPKTSPPSPIPATPPLQSKLKKPLLVIGETASPSPSTPATDEVYGKEVVDKRIRVYWPMDKSWYEGFVKSFDKHSRKHLVVYDDFEEELLDLGKEKIEWVEESVKKFKRLRRGSLGLKKKTVIEDEEMEDTAEDNPGGGDDDSSDEDWGENVEKEVSDEEGDICLGLEEEEEGSEQAKRGKKRLGKRKANGGWKLSPVKKGKSAGDAGSVGFKASVVEPVKEECK